ncbi:hypothetical protein M407DRAFT_241360 [Tulasnella calospora MUT 4182]|uniref:Uncharacterized protein n=1 Tax=Tulasnella calospora MUT 4182 TaxID=1051891 RepID=A0A0C3LFG3_9AGAM|nr:hypothetical protein M407DRAFT_241360 [Tulasnella calospora MUT 4182]
MLNLRAVATTPAILFMPDGSVVGDFGMVTNPSGDRTAEGDALGGREWTRILERCCLGGCFKNCSWWRVRVCWRVGGKRGDATSYIVATGYPVTD